MIFHKKQIKMDDGAKIALWDTQGKGKPIIFVHGFPETHLSWENLIDFLPKPTRYRYIVYDLRGHGSSSKTGEASLDRFFQDQLEIVKALKLKKYHLVGHDWGGAVALHAARFVPETLLSLSVLNTNYGSLDWMGMWHMLFLNLPMVPELSFRLMPGVLYQFVKKRAFVNLASVSKRADLSYRRSFRDAATVRYWMKLYRNLGRGLVLKQLPWIGTKFGSSKFNSSKQAWQVPTLLIWGKDDTFNPLWVGKDIYQRLKNKTEVKFYTVPKSGHFVQVEQPEKVAGYLVKHWGK